MSGAIHFEIYRAPGVILTKLLRGGGDWRWRLCDARGTVLARGDGYRTREDCLAVVDVLRCRASVANVVDLSRTEFGAAAQSPHTP